MRKTSSYESRIYIRRGGRIEGPIGVGKVFKEYRSGQLHPDTEASMDRRRWMPIQQIISTMLTETQTPSSSESPATGHKGTVKGKGARGVFRISSDPGRSPDAETTAPDQHNLADIRTSAISFTKPQTVLWVLTCALFPLVLLWASEAAELTISQTVWMTSGYYCLIYALILRFSLAVDNVRWKQGLLYSAFTAFIGIPVLYIWYHLPIFYAFQESLQSAAPWRDRFINHTIYAGLLEEGCKLLPLIFFGMRYGGMSRPSDGLWLGIMSGLGFAWAEGVNYTIFYWNTSALDQIAILVEGYQIDAAEEVVVGDMVLRSWWAFMAQQTRFLTLPLLHSGFTAIGGLFAAYAYCTGRWWALGVGWLVASTVHGLYNSLSDGLGGILVAAGLLLCLLFLMENTRMKATRSHS